MPFLIPILFGALGVGALFGFSSLADRTTKLIIVGGVAFIIAKKFKVI